MNEWMNGEHAREERREASNDYYRNQQFTASLITTENQIIVIVFDQSRSLSRSRIILQFSESTKTQQLDMIFFFLHLAIAPSIDGSHKNCNWKNHKNFSKNKTSSSSSTRCPLTRLERRNQEDDDDDKSKQRRPREENWIIFLHLRLFLTVKSDRK